MRQELIDKIMYETHIARCGNVHVGVKLRNFAMGRDWQDSDEAGEFILSYISHERAIAEAAADKYFGSHRVYSTDTYGRSNGTFGT